MLEWELVGAQIDIFAYVCVFVGIGPVGCFIDGAQ